MKRWAIATVAIYAVMLLLLTVPVIWLGFGETIWGHDNGASIDQIMTFRKEPLYWIWLVVMLTGQSLLLFLPVRFADRRLKARRPLLVPVVTTAFFLALLFTAGMISVLCVLFKDKAFEIFDVAGRFAVRDMQAQPVLKFLFRRPVLTGPPPGSDYLYGVITIVAICWVLWALVFYFFARRDEPESLVRRSTRWLLTGSILEFLVAVPSHIIVRNRDDCCAPIGTFWGITIGLSVMLMCFGPGVFFLFAERFGRLRSTASNKEILAKAAIQEIDKTAAN